MEKRPPLPFSLLKEIFRKKGVTEIEYGELLWTEECLQFRQTIKERDEFTFTDCGVSQYKKDSCPRCSGRGYFREYAHVQGGRCFQCGGLGGVQRGRSSNSFFLKS
jgi:hypothetical protein